MIQTVGGIQIDRRPGEITDDILLILISAHMGENDGRALEMREKTQNPLGGAMMDIRISNVQAGVKDENQIFLENCLIHGI